MASCWTLVVGIKTGSSTRADPSLHSPNLKNSFFWLWWKSICRSTLSHWFNYYKGFFSFSSAPIRTPFFVGRVERVSAYYIIKSSLRFVTFLPQFLGPRDYGINLITVKILSSPQILLMLSLISYFFFLTYNSIAIDCHHYYLFTADHVFDWLGIFYSSLSVYFHFTHIFRHKSLLEILVFIV